MPSVIRRSLLHRISHANLERLIEHVFAEAALPLSWSARADWCYATVTRTEPPVPPSVRDVFDVLHALSNEAGGRALLEVAMSQGVDLIARLGHVSREDRAVLAYLEHPEVFFAAGKRVRMSAVPEAAFVVFAGPAQSRSAIDEVAGRREQLEAVVTFWQKAAGRPGRPIVRFQPHPTFLLVDVLTSGLPTTQVGLDGELVPAAEFQDATILLDLKQRFAAIRADNREDVEFYRQLAGAAVGGNFDAFYSAPIVTLPSLTAPGALERLEVTVPGLASVRVRRAELGLKQQGTVVVSRAAIEAPSWSPELLSLLSGEVRLTLELCVTDGGPAHTLHIAPPNELRFNHLAIGGQVLQLLQTLQLLSV